MILKQTFSEPIQGYFDYGPKTIFEWKIDGLPLEDDKGKFVKVGSWDANKWYMVSLGKTEKQTLANLRRKLQSYAKRCSKNCTFEYIEKESF